MAIINILTEAGANPNMGNYFGDTPLFYVARHIGDYTESMAHALIKAGADINACNRKGATAILESIPYGRFNTSTMIRLLIEAGVDVNKKYEGGMTALMLAVADCSRYYQDIIITLIDKGANVNILDDVGWNALMFALEPRQHFYKQSETMVRMLVKHGATLPKLDDMPEIYPEVKAYIDGSLNWTPIHRAADARDVNAIIKCMSEGMRHDTVVDSTHQYMRTALSIAESTSYPTAQPVCEGCLEILRPNLIKSEVPIDGSLFGSGGGGGKQT